MVSAPLSRRDDPDLSLGQKLLLLNWGLVLVVCAIAAVGVAMLYSVGGGWNPWAWRHAVRFAPGLAVMIVLALIDIRFYMRMAYVAYGGCLALLVLVEAMGRVGMGAQRWIDLGVIVLQPSELMKIALVLVLARYFHGLTADQVRRPLVLLPPLAMVAAPVGLVLMQPNLGTATLLTLAAGALFFAAGVRLWKFALVLGAVAAAIPIGWELLRDYQRRRVYTFLDPESDPLGAGYNIIQSKIALGSGGLFGKGFGQGSQSQLMFLPERHTDFIFVVMAEELGLAGVSGLLLLYALLLGYGMVIAVSARTQFARLTAVGLTVSFFLYVVVNVSMVTGMIPVVGIPLPLVSYGGTAMLTLLAGCGVLVSVSIHRDVRIPRAGLDG